MKNNYNKLTAFVLLALISVSSQALLYKNEYFVWTYHNVAETEAGMGELAIAGLKGLSRRDTAQFWNSGEPNNSGSIEHCVTQTKNGGWNDTKCDENRPMACFNGTSWAISSNVNLQNGSHSNSRPAGCPAGYEFAAPMNLDQKLALDAVIPNGGTVWINGFDNDRGVYPRPNPTAKEGVWVFNRGITHLFGPNWANGEPANDGAKNCASVNASGQWVAENCSQPRAVVCAKQDFSEFQIITPATASITTEAMHSICRTAASPAGEQWMFAAPRSLAENNLVQSAVSSKGAGSAWVNASGNRVGQTWQTNLDLTNWAAGEPNLSNGQCVVARAADGKWQMADCDSTAKLLCYNPNSTGNSNWIIRNAFHQFSNQALDACKRPNNPTEVNNTFSEYRLVTPITVADRAQAFNALRTGSNLYWLNLKYITDTNDWLRNDQYKTPEFNGGNPQTAVWYHVFKDGDNNALYGGSLNKYETGATIDIGQAGELNKGVNTYFADKEPNGGDKSPRSSCIQLYASGGNAGLWDDTNCTNPKRVACFDGYEWAISPSSVGLGVDADTSENINNGHDACAGVRKDNGVIGNFVFAAPRSFAQSQQLLTVARESGAATVWINMNSKKYKRVFVLNSGAEVLAPFWNPNEPNNAGGNEDCAVQTASGKWNDLPCGSTNPVACYSPYEKANGTWKVTTGTHQYSDTDELTKLCETTFGAQYKFYAPETLSQMRDLKAVMTNAGVANAYINANDIAYEGTWLMNQGINNWAVGQQPYATTNNNNCVSANALDGQWRTQSCTSQLAVACTTGSSWKFTTAKVDLANFANGQAACDAQFGQGHIFKAPRDLSDAEELQYSAKLAGLGADYWINGNRLETPTTWKWNQSFVKTPVWGEGQPSGGSKNNCALLNNNTQAAWQDARCDIAANFAYLCRNGNQWKVSTKKGNLEDFSSATTACSNLGAGWRFAAPKTYNENVEAKNAMASENQIWLNATDAIKEGVWILNSAPVATYPNWAGSLQPGNCAFQQDDGELYTIDCSSAAQNAWACTDGSNWRVTASKGQIESFAQGHKACLKEYGANFIFAAPLTKDDAIQIDFARSLTATENNTSISKVWLNMTTGGSAQIATNETPARKFRRNLPFTNWDGLVAGNEPAVGTCAYKNSTLEGVNNPWVTSNCSSSTAHYACTNGSVWAVATAKGRVENGVVEIVPTAKDYWSYERGNSMCKEQFDRSFYFSAPVTAAEELALDTAIRNTQAQTKRVWINTYSVGGFSSFNNNWFVNRLKLGVWQKPKFRNYNSSDCAILHKDDGIDGLNGSWTDVSCKSDAQKYAFACYKGEWSIKGSGDWEEGFAACAANDDSMFAVPRTPDEMQALQAVMGTEPVWINLTDNALESQWIANRLRFTWWDENEPSNFGNRDCARVRSGISNNGKWYAGKCSIEAAPFACRSTDGGVQWNVTESEGIWSDGFGACEREFPGSLFMAPEGFATMSAMADQEALASVAKTATKDPWINLSDQDVEGDWRAHRAFSDWGTSSPFDEARDCGYLDRSSKGVGTWFADACKYTASEAKSRGYACTDGYQWEIINEESTTDMHWSGGFVACRNAGLRFAAPTNALENTKLKLAMELHSKEPNEIWINAHDRFVEGEWQLNGPEVNFAPVIDVSETAIEVSENTASIQLKATLTDDEEMGIASATWSLVSNRGAITGKDASVADFNDIEVTNVVVTHDPTNGSATVTAEYSTPVLFKEDRILRFKVTATDIAPSAAATAATAESFVEVRVLGPLVAAWDFNNTTLAFKDITGHGHDALNTSVNPFPRVVLQDGNGVLKLDSDSQMIVPGRASDPENGIEYPADNYTIAFRMSIEKPAEGTDGFRGIMQKGDVGGDRQPGLMLIGGEDRLSASQTLDKNDGWHYRDTNLPSALNTLQWINVIYVQDSAGTTVYIDGVQEKFEAADPLYPALKNNGNFYVGNSSDVAGGSFVGFIDDIQVYNRALTAGELTDILPEPPLGSVHFLESSASVDEFIPAPSTYDIKLERTRGTRAPLTVYVDFDAATSTATLGDITDMDIATHEADLALINYTAGQGVPVSWAAGEKGAKSFQIKLDNADDEIREGTETARFIIKDLGDAKLGSNKEFNLRLLDKTPNPFGNFSVSIDGNSLKRVSEDSSAQKICFARESGTTGAVTVNYLVTGVAVETTDSVQGDFSYGAGSIIPTEAMNSGVENTLLFADGEGGETEADKKCIIIEPFNNPTTGETDKDYSVQITSLSHDASIDPILTEMNAARLVIYDFSPGEFAFSTSSYTCKEPNTDITIPEGIRPEADAVCKITVERLNTGNTAPAAVLNVLAENSYEGGIAYTFTPQLNFPAIDAENPKVPANEIQTIDVIIENNNVQDDDLNVQFTLQGTSNPVEVIAGGRGSAVLQILDITAPALVKLTRDKAEINEGETVVYTVTREGNINTYFNFNYNVLINPNMNRPFDYHINTSNGIAQTGSLSFEKGIEQTHTLTFNTIDTPANGLDYLMQVTLSNSSNNNVVGFGDYESIGKSGNQVVATNTVKNTRDLVADNYSVTIEDLGSDPAKVSPQTFSHNNGAIANAGEYLAVHKQQVPDTRQIRLTLKIPKGLHIDSGVGFSWKLLNPDGTNASWHDGIVEVTNVMPRFKEGRNGSIPYDAAGVNKTEDYIVTTRIDLPFVVKDTDFKLQLDINGNTEVFSKTIEFTVKPLYRRLKNDANNRCLRGHLTDTLVVDCGNKDQWPDLYWTWHSEKSFLISLFSIQNNETAACIDIPATRALSTTNARMRECASQASRTATFHSDKTFRIDNTVTCRYSVNNNKIMRKSGCSNNDDRKWTWTD